MQFSRVVGVVTGGASGLGRATVERIAKSGAKCVIADLGATDGAKIAEQLNETYGEERVKFFETDVRDETQVQGAVDAADVWGGLNLAVNCAGIAPAIKTLGRKGVHPLDKFQATMDINVVGSFNVARLAAEKMSARDPLDEFGNRGMIINTASISAYEGQAGQAAYAASKGAIVSMTLPMARDFTKLGIRVCAIAPGMFETPMLIALPDKVRAGIEAKVPFPSRLGHPDEYAMLVESMYCNPFMNGEVIRLDGAARLGF